ncbi:MAG TPA: 30S ribosomal protein S20 [Candidatus Saccharimonadia bacterium]
MPIIQSAIKRAKQSLVRRSRNLHVRREVKRDITALQTAIADGQAGEIQEKLNAAYSEIDRAVKKHTIHKNTAARRKSQLAHAVAKGLGAEAVPAETKTTKGAGKKAVTTKATTKKAPAKAPAAKKPAATKATPKASATKKAPAKKTDDKSEK